MGCSSGALAREFKKLNLHAHYIGIELDEGYANLAKRYCDKVYQSNIENMDEALWDTLSQADCWIFGNTLEHFQNPWAVLKRYGP